MTPPRRRFSAIHAVVGWLLILVLAIANGGLRESLLIPSLGRAPATAVSGLMLMAAVMIVSTVLFRRHPPRTPAQGWQVGIGWLAGTVAFEFGMGRWMLGKPCSDLLAAYTFTDGNLWPLVLFTVLLAPPWLARRR